MTDLFKTRRRKFGVMALALACLLMAGWVRSFRINDEIEDFPGKSAYELRSTDGMLRITWISLDYSASSGVQLHSSPACKLGLPRPLRTDQLKWRWQFCGFDFGEGRIEQIYERVRYYTFPYWSLTLPMTALSAYLLVSKPQTTQAKNADPASNSGPSLKQQLGIITPWYPPRDPFLFCFMSFLIPGLGQVVAGQIAKGLFLLAVLFLAPILLFYVFPPGVGVLMVLLWILILVDAYKIASRLKKGHPVSAWEFFFDSTTFDDNRDSASS